MPPCAKVIPLSSSSRLMMLQLDGRLLQRRADDGRMLGVAMKVLEGPKAIEPGAMVPGGAGAAGERRAGVAARPTRRASAPAQESGSHSWALTATRSRTTWSPPTVTEWDVLFLIGRVLFALIFIFLGLDGPSLDGGRVDRRARACRPRR